MSTKLIDQAAVFCIAAHQAVGQVRKYTGEAYYNHPARVAGIVQTVAHSDEMICAAYLHDTLEDTEVSYEDILLLFGVEIAEYVQMLTNTPKTATNNRAQRKEQDRVRLSLAPAEVQTIKVADMIDNTSDIILHDEKFAATYIDECRALLDVLTKANPLLIAQLREIVG